MHHAFCIMYEGCVLVWVLSLCTLWISGCFWHYADVMSSFTKLPPPARLLWLGYHASPIQPTPQLSQHIYSCKFTNICLWIGKYICVDLINLLWISVMDWRRFSQMTDSVAGFSKYKYVHISCGLSTLTVDQQIRIFGGFANIFLWICEMDWWRFSQMTDSVAGRLAFQNANVFTQASPPIQNAIKCQMHEG